MRRMMTVISLLLTATALWAIPGDLNLDGKVDFEDFFLFADQFGKEGPPDTLRVIVTDTVTVIETVVEVDTTRVTVYDTLPVVLRDTITQIIRDTVAIRDTFLIVLVDTVVARDTVYVEPVPVIDTSMRQLAGTYFQYGTDGRVYVTTDWRFISYSESCAPLIIGSYRMKWDNRVDRKMLCKLTRLDFRDSRNVTIIWYDIDPDVSFVLPPNGEGTIAGQFELNLHSTLAEQIEEISLWGSVGR